jgi:hypothetical protein
MRGDLKTAAALLVIIAAIAYMPTAAPAAIVAPGGSFTTDGDTFVEPSGDVVASDARTVTLTFDTSPYEPSTSPSEPTYTFDLNFTSQVLRDPATQRLTFVYRFDQPAGDRGIAREPARSPSAASPGSRPT